MVLHLLCTLPSARSSGPWRVCAAGPVWSGASQWYSVWLRLSGPAAPLEHLCSYPDVVMIAWFLCISCTGTGGSAAILPVRFQSRLLMGSQGGSGLCLGERNRCPSVLFLLVASPSWVPRFSCSSLSFLCAPISITYTLKDTWRVVSDGVSVVAALWSVRDWALQLGHISPTDTTCAYSSKKSWQGTHSGQAPCPRL